MSQRTLRFPPAEQPTYAVGTWDSSWQAFTPQIGLDRWYGLDIHDLRRALKRLRELQ